MLGDPLRAVVGGISYETSRAVFAEVFGGGWRDAIVWAFECARGFAGRETDSAGRICCCTRRTSVKLTAISSVHCYMPDCFP